jgi:SAM-dependent methyltransferase
MPRAKSVLAYMTLFMGLAFGGIFAASSQRLDVPYVPTPQSVVDRMLELTGVGKDDIVYDLGSGDGRIAITAVKNRGAKQAFGIDINPVRIKEANENAKIAGVSDRVTFIEQDLFKTDFSKATVLTMYLLTDVNLRLRSTILDTLKPGTRVVSHAFNMGDWEPDYTDKPDGRDVFMWIVPAKVEGRWEVTAKDRKFGVVLRQEYQNLKGEASVDGKAAKLTAAPLSGATISFTIEGLGKFTGKADGDKIEGDGWSAVRTARNI